VGKRLLQIYRNRGTLIFNSKTLIEANK